MIRFKNNELGKMVSFNKYYKMDGRGREVLCPLFNQIGEIVDYREGITEHGTLYAFVVKDLNSNEYFVHEENCAIID